MCTRRGRVEQANPALLGGISYWETENGDSPMTSLDERGVCQRWVTQTCRCILTVMIRWHNADALRRSPGVGRVVDLHVADLHFLPVSCYSHALVAQA